MGEGSAPGNNGPGQIVAGSRCIRLAIFVVATSLTSACAVFNVVSNALIFLFRILN